MSTEPVENVVALKKIRAYLENNPNHFITAKELAQYAGLPTSGTQVRTRNLITQLISEFNCPIISNDRGFCWADNPLMLQEYLRDLQVRLAGLQFRINCVERNYQVMINGGPLRRCGGAEFCACGEELRHNDTGDECRFCRAKRAVQETTAKHTATYSELLYKNNTDTDTAKKNAAQALFLSPQD